MSNIDSDRIIKTKIEQVVLKEDYNEGIFRIKCTI